MGSQTSILMSESLLGRSVAATRQKAGRLAGETVALNPPAGMLNAPAATVWARVMVVSGNFRDARRSQVAAWVAAGQIRAIAAKAVHRFGSIFESIIYAPSGIAHAWMSRGERRPRDRYRPASKVIGFL